ncbi:MAG TPA: hypothetical protein VEO54_19290 [Thermoanaerobaculia bacterium]|nr:hypothetical protein [Thermoanaerobaculia bacterium]
MTRVLRSFVVLMAVAVLALPAAAKDDALSLVPANAVTVGMVKLSDMRSSPLSGFLFLHMDKMSTDGEAAKFLSDAGLQPTRDVDTLVVATTPRSTLGSEADVLVIAEGRFQPEKLTSAIVSRGAVKKGAYILLPEKEGENGAVAFLSPSLAIAGNERSVIAALEARANGGTGFRSRGALGLDLGRVDAKATAWALVDVTRAARLAKGGDINTGKGQSGEALQAAIKTLQTVAVWATDTGDALELGAIGLSNDSETLQLLEDTVKGALAAMRLAVKDKQPELVSVLRRFDINRKSDSITVEGSIPAATLRDLMNKKKAAVAVGSK